jgi:hypothetical protein
MPPTGRLWALGFWLRVLIDCILRGVVSVKQASSDLNFFSSTAAADGPQPVAPIEANCCRGWKSAIADTISSS